MSSKKLYTINMDWNGGNYTSQFISKNLNYAIEEWGNSIDIRMIKIKKKDKKKFLIELKKETPILLNNLKNVWCITPKIQKKLAIVNVILTSEV